MLLAGCTSSRTDTGFRRPQVDNAINRRPRLTVRPDRFVRRIASRPVATYPDVQPGVLRDDFALATSHSAVTGLTDIDTGGHRRQ